MTKRRIVAVALAVLILGGLLWEIDSPAPPDSAPAAAGAPASAPVASLAPASRSPAPGRSPLADTLNSSATDIRADLRVVAGIVETFRSNFPSTGNPTGTNAEITAALTGKNQLQLALIPPDHAAIDREGQLCDRWGTPFFFHAESATRMTIQSAGPDKKFYTADDEVSGPE